MKPEITPDTLQEYIRKLGLFWYAIFGSIVFFAVVTLFVAGSSGISARLPEKMAVNVTYLLTFLGVTQFVVALHLNRRFKSKSGIDHFLSGKGVTAIKAKLPPSEKLDDFYLTLALLPHYFQAALICWSLVAATAFYGLLIAIFCGETGLAFGFYLFSAFAMIWFRTSENGLQSLVTTVRKGEGEPGE